MNVSSYLFQSPYPSQVQIGRPDPSAQQQAQQNDSVTQIAKNEMQPTQAKADAFLAANRTGASVNVANASTDTAVSTALESFATASSQIQAAEAYSA